jgi:segregation and condensation protein B
MTDHQPLKAIVEGALIAAGGPLTLDQLLALFGEDERPERAAILGCIRELSADYEGRGIEIAEVAGGYRVQVRASVAPWVARLWDEKAPRYSRALLETLALIAYRQPITRGEIEDIRGVAVSTNIIKTLTEREWVRVVGHRDVPGRPALYATTRRFLDYFGLRSLNELPPLSEIRDPESYFLSTNVVPTSEPTENTP